MHELSEALVLVMMVMMMATADLGAGADQKRNRIVSYRKGRRGTLVHELGHAGHLLISIFSGFHFGKRLGA